MISVLIRPPNIFWPLHLINLVQGLLKMSRCSLLIFRSHFQRSRSNHSSQPTVLSTLYILIHCWLASSRFCFYREDKPEFSTMGAYMFLKDFLLRLRWGDRTPISRMRGEATVAVCHYTYPTTTQHQRILPKKDMMHKITFIMFPFLSRWPIYSYNEVLFRKITKVFFHE